MKNIFRTKYRIVSDNYLGFQVDAKRWFWPFWYQVDFSNTFPSIEEAKKFIKGKINTILYEESK